MCSFAFLVPNTGRAAKPLAACSSAAAWQGAMPSSVDESLRYTVEIDAFGVGAVGFRIARTRFSAGEPAAAYRSVFKLDHLLAAMAHIDGQAESLVRLGASSPTTALSHYSLGGTTFDEALAFEDGGRRVRTTRWGAPAQPAPDKAPTFLQPVVDFVTGFYLLRRLPAKEPACMTVYGNQHYYFVWATPDGAERIKTPIGMRPADVYAVRYRQVGADSIGSGRIWLSQTAERVPYQIHIDASRRIGMRLHTYAMGRPQNSLKPPYDGASD